MNSYEFDQPLDLRLKALNLSRLHHHHHHHHQEAPQFVHHLNLSQQAHPMAMVNLSATFYSPPCDTANSNSTSPSGCQQQQQQHYSEQAPPSQPPPPPVTTAPTQFAPISGVHPQLNCSGGEQSVGARLEHNNIHHQPLNHHQPHPLSRLHLSPSAQSTPVTAPAPPPPPPPPPPPLPPTHSAGGSTSSSSSDMLYQHHHQHHQSLPHRLTIGSSSLQNLAHQNSAGATTLGAIRHRHGGYSPPLQPLHQRQEQHHFHQPHQHHSHNYNLLHHSHAHSHAHHPHAHPHHAQHHFQPAPLPVRSLSMSGQMLTPSHLSLMVSPNSTPPQTGSGGPTLTSSSSSVSLHQRMESPNTNKQQTSDTSQQQQQQQQQPQTAPIPTPSVRKSSNNSLSPPVVGSPAGGTGDQTTSGGSTTSSSSSPPIVRQHSLVSRYNCKPCGIAFSQPETLRAHQEGYCTKTNRNQLRSQSAVSPSALQQTTAATHNQSNK